MYSTSSLLFDLLIDLLVYSFVSFKHDIVLDLFV